MKKKIEVTINGELKSLEIKSGEMLLDVLRREGYRGAKVGCREGFCGACTVLLDGRPVNSCLVFAAKAGGRSITTIEGLGEPGRLHPIQEAFIQNGAVHLLMLESDEDVSYVGQPKVGDLLRRNRLAGGGVVAGEDGRVRGVLLWNFWNQVKNARALMILVGDDA